MKIITHMIECHNYHYQSAKEIDGFNTRRLQGTNIFKRRGEGCSVHRPETTVNDYGFEIVVEI
jgi:hypothetical protein